MMERKNISDENLLAQARAVLDNESEALARLSAGIGESFIRAVRLIDSSAGRVIVSGVGKSGLVGRKIAATLTSTGTPAHFMHPVDSLHGDIGLVSPEDVFIAISKSGETSEMEQLIHLFKRLGVKIIAITGNGGSFLGRLADVAISVPVEREACPHDLAPTTSTTAVMAVGDALAVCLLQMKDFSPEQFASLHPAGALGGKLLLRVEELMLSGDSTPRVAPATPMKEVIVELVGKRGICTVVDKSGRLLGVVTDGDLKRLLSRTLDIMDIPASEVMNREPKNIEQDELCITAVKKMEKYSIVSMPVVDKEFRVVGIVHLHDLMRARII